MNASSFGVDVSGALAVAERSEPERSAATAKAGGDAEVALRPDPEVVAKAKRRTYTVSVKPDASGGRCQPLASFPHGTSRE